MTANKTTTISNAELDQVTGGAPAAAEERLCAKAVNGRFVPDNDFAPEGLSFRSERSCEKWVKKNMRGVVF